MNRRTWLLLAAALFAISALTALGTVANASLPTGTGQSVEAVVGAPQTQSKDQPFDCSQIDAKGINKQMNLRAAQIMVDCGRGGEVIPQAEVKGSGGDFSPDVYGGTDVNVHPSLSTGIQSETFSWKQGNTVVVTYNDLSGGSTGKGSYSTDGGITFARIPGDPFGTGHGTNLGDPTVVYSVLNAKWVVNFLATGCGGQGVGAWTSTDGITWTAGGCAATAGSGNGDRNSAWADNHPGSAFNGRVYATWNDFGIGGGALRVSWSTNGGTTWSAPVSVTTNFIRDVQLTGLPDATGTLILAGMNEGGGGAANRQNIFYRSTNGGAAWTTHTANTFAPPGNVNCSGNSYFRVITPQIRHMGWGQPAGGPGGVVHYAYAAHGAATDEGDIYYIRSTDSGVTWSAPLQMNTDGTARAQWMPSVGVTPGGAVFVSWYDRRDTTNNNYWRYGRASLDNGVTWQPDDKVSDAEIPQPIVQTANCYMGDYDYWHGEGTTVQGSWTDSRGQGSGGTQDTFHDSISLIQGTPTPTVTGTPPTSTPTLTRTNTPTVTPTVCGATAPYSFATATGATVVPGTVDIGNHGDDVITLVTLPFTYQVYDMSFTTVNVSSNGNLQFNSAITGLNDYVNACLPVTDRAYSYTIFALWDDQITAPAGKGIFSSVSGVAPNRIFNLEFRTCGFSTATTCAAGTDTNYEVRLYEGQKKFDLIYAAMGLTGASATVGIQKNTTTFSQHSCNTAIAAGTMVTGSAGSCGTTTPVPSSTTVPGASATAVPPTSTAPPSATSVPPSATTIPASATAAATATCMPASGTQNVIIDSFSFTPQDLTVAAGTTVMWTNNGGSHSTTSDAALWDSGVLAVGGQFSYTFDTPGTYAYHCSVHPGAMTGTITVGAPCATSTVVPSATPDPTATTAATAIPTSTVCTLSFTDVPPIDEFYPYIMCLACRGIVSGYDDGTFRPYNDIIRGQIAKIVSNSAGYADPIPGGTQTFTDVPSSNPFYIWIERVHIHGSITGYPCGGPFEPCDGSSRPYFRPYANATRGQLSKIVAISANITDPVPSGQQTYTDVLPSSTFWLYIEQLTAMGVMGGYPCGGPGEPCDSENRPYFRPNSNVTRAQASKIVANTFFPSCTPSSK